MKYIVIILIMLIFGAVVFGVVNYLKKMAATPTKDGADHMGATTDGPDLNTTQGFLPYDEVVGNMIRVGDNYRCIIECNSVNYYLLSDTEQDILETKFNSLIDGMDYVFAFYVQTRQKDNRQILESFAKDVEKLRETLPAAVNYGEQFLAAFQEKVANTDSKLITKKKYIIVCSDNLEDLKELDSKQRNEHAAEQLSQRAGNIRNTLSSIGITSSVLSRGEVLELLKLSLSKGVGGNVDGIVNGEFMEDYVKGTKNDIRDDVPARLELDLRSFENKFMEYGMNGTVPEDKLDLYNAMLDDVMYIRKRYCGIFSQYDLDNSLNYYDRKQDGIANRDRTKKVNDDKTEIKTDYFVNNFSNPNDENDDDGFDI